jgi:hypothetical protein
LAVIMRISVNKRLKEKAREEKQQGKAQRRKERKSERDQRAPPAPGVDPDIADIVPGPQPLPESDTE